MFSSSIASRPAVWPNKPPVQWVTTAGLLPCVKWPDTKDPPCSSRLIGSGPVRSLSHMP
jgi:hypothetical protein